MPRRTWAFLSLITVLGALSAEIPLPPGAVARLGLGVPTDLRVSPDGRLLALATAIGVEIRSAETLELLAFLAPHRAWVNALALSPDGETLAAAFSDGTVTLWQVRDWTELNTLSLPDAVMDLAWSFDVEALFAAVGNKVYRADPATGEIEALWELPPGGPSGPGIVGLAVSPAGELAVITLNEAWLLELATKAVRWKRVFPLTFAARPLFLPTGELVLSAPDLRALDPRTGRDVWQRPGLMARTLAVHGSLLAAAFGPSLVLLDLILGTEAWIPVAHARDVVGLALAEDALFSVALDGALKAWDPQTRKLLRSLEAVRSPVYALALSPSESLLAVGSETVLHVWDLRTRKVRTLDGGFEFVTALGLSEERLLSVDRQTARVLDVAVGETLASSTKIRGSLPWPWGFQISALSARGELVASDCGELPRRGAPPSCSVCLWSGKDFRLLRRLEIEGCPWMPQSLALSADGKLLAVGYEKRVDVWDWAAAARIHEFPLGDCEPMLLALSPRGRFLAVELGTRKKAEECQALLLWDLSLGSQLKALDLGEDVTALAFAPNEEWLAVGTLSGRIFLVDMTGPKLSGRIFTGYTGTVFGLAFSLDGAQLYSGSTDGTVLVWQIPSDAFGR